MTDRIAAITAHVISADPRPHPWWSHKPYVLVRVETAEGLVGWGECHTLTHREQAMVATLQALARMLEGKPAGDIRALMPFGVHGFGQQRPGLEVYSALAGIEIALWDILGKRAGLPVYALLGGACHDRIGVYANIYSPSPKSPEAMAAMALDQVTKGHRAIKLYPFQADTRIDEGVAILAAVREAVGPEIGLAVDLWRHASPARALDLARAMEPFDLLWLEDPFAPTDAPTLRYLRDQICQPLLTGETLPTRKEFDPILSARAVDIINPDICLSGILELQAIAAAAEASFVTLSPHNSNSMALGTAAAVHACLGIPNLSLLETFPLFDAALDSVCEGRLVPEDGFIGRPERPGIGITFDEAAMVAYRV